MGDARSFLGPTSKIPPLGSMLNFDADVKKGLRVTNVKTVSHRLLPLDPPCAESGPCVRACCVVCVRAASWIRSPLPT